MNIGVIADDFTGATDIAGFLVTNGIRTIQTTGIPDERFEAEAEAYVLSLKSRSCPADEAIRLSLEALHWLRDKGCEQIFFKYCSTFDSTAKGNIGPVTDALLDEMGEEFTILCPALPVNGRTLYRGYLFVGNQLLSESGMQHHPVTPMRDSNIARLMEQQSRGKAGNIYVEVLDKGPSALKRELLSLKEKGIRYAVMDTLNQEHLDTIGAAVADFPLVTGGSGLAAGIARSLHKEGEKRSAEKAGRPKKGATVIIAGSCSKATNRQVARYREKAPSQFIDALRCRTDAGYLDELYAWTTAAIEDGATPLLYATKQASELEKPAYASQDVGRAIEELFGKLASRLLGAGVKNFIVAGGETAGKVVQSLGLSAFFIGPQIDPGVPWVRAVGQDLYLALKSGNFGSDDFFVKAQEFFI